MEKDWTILTIDQHHKSVTTVRRHGWFKKGSKPNISVSGSRKSLTLLGATSDDSEDFYVGTEDNLTAQHTILWLRALKENYDGKLVILLDRAPYFYAKAVWKFVSGEESTTFVGDTSVECVRGDDLQLWYFPPYTPKLNPQENCWDKLKSWFNHRLIRNLNHLKKTLNKGLKSINAPNIINYLSP